MDGPETSSGRIGTYLRERVVPALTRPLRSLPSRIIVSVFAAALVTSLVVTGVSTHSIQAFLRQKVDQKLPALLDSTAERLELWYSQRRLDIETFARSTTVVENVPRMASARRAGRARAEIERYLAYVLERFHQYQALFLLDREGEVLLWVGTEFPLDESQRRGLGSVSGARLSELLQLGPERVQVASSPVEVETSKPLGSLHAVMDLDALHAVLATAEVGPQGAMYLVGPDGGTLVRSDGAPARQNYARTLPSLEDAPRVEDYTNAAGEHVVGSALRFSRFGWSLVVEQSYDEVFAPVVSVISQILAINLGIVLLFGLIAFQIARSIVKPIQALSDGARRIAGGETDVVIPRPSSRDEIEVLTNVFNEMTARLQANQLEIERNRVQIEAANARLVAKNEELQRMNEVLGQLSITDGLTKLHNHRFFQDHLGREMRRSARTGSPLSLILMDIDDFKKLNDRFGHAVGDAVLKQVAEVMNGVVRETDLLARYGGEEFALLATQTDREGAEALAEKVRTEVREARLPFEDEAGRRLSITVSVGVAQFHGDEKALFNDADRALYQAKHSGKDCVVCAEAPASG